MLRILLTLALSVLAALPVFAQLSPGDLAAPHESLEGLTTCTECHELGEGPSSEKCLTCHAALRRTIESSRGYHSFQTKDRTCVSCHSDHNGKNYQLINWPHGRDEFDHAQAGYDLQGAHGKTPCRECHNPVHLQKDLIGEEPSIDATQTFLGLDPNCLSCHRDEHRAQLGADCLKCHDPAGFKPAQRFDHSSARFALKGKHRQTDCSKCHELLVDASTGRADTTYAKYRGIPFDSCVKCHFDEHRGQLGSDCLKCHDPSGFKPAKRFDHASARFALTGKHLQVECVKCHELLVDASADPARTNYTKYRNIPFGGCVECHKDKHDDRFGTRCDQCHQTSGWKNIVASTFDHSKTGFKLEGKHFEVACNKCHRGESFLGKLEHDDCVRCHADRHAGQFARREDGGRCESCHTVESFSPATFTIANHEKARFVLVGAHLAQPCVRCHKTRLPVSDPPVTEFTFEDRSCPACHQDRHRGQFVRSKPVKECTACHGTDVWAIESFDHSAKTRYQLVGAHQKVECEKCHPTTPGDPPMVAYRTTATRCIDCHVNSGQLDVFVEGED